MQKHESYMKQAVVEITGKIGNNGGRTLHEVEINCVFYDPYGQVVLQEAGADRGPEDRRAGAGGDQEFPAGFRRDSG